MTIDAARLGPIHPGETLRDILEGLDDETGRKHTRQEIADALGVHRATLQRLLACDQDVSVDMAIRLGRAFGQTPHFWLNAQARFEAALAEERAKDAGFKDVKRLVG